MHRKKKKKMRLLNNFPLPRVVHDVLWNCSIVLTSIAILRVALCEFNRRQWTAKSVSSVGAWSRFMSSLFLRVMCCRYRFELIFIKRLPMCLSNWYRKAFLSARPTRSISSLFNLLLPATFHLVYFALCHHQSFKRVVTQSMFTTDHKMMMLLLWKKHLSFAPTSTLSSISMKWFNYQG